jgi:uncharacterized membrane protein
VEVTIKTIVGYASLALETAGALLIAIGAAQAFFEMVRRAFTRQFVRGTRKATLVQFGVWLLLGLEFELGADIIRSAISPTWSAIGQLAAIATIRTALNFFLERDIEKFGDAGTDAEAPRPTRMAA